MPRFARQLEDRVEIDRRAEEVHGDHAAHARTQRGGDVLGGDQVRIGIDVDRHRRRAHRADRLGRRDERVGRHDHLVARADLQGAQRERERLGAGGHADREIGLAVGGEVLLEGLDVVAQRERALLGDFAHGPQQLLEQLGVGVVHAGEGNLPRAGGRHGVCRGRGAVCRGCARHAGQLAAQAIEGAESRRRSSSCSALRPR